MGVRVPPRTFPTVPGDAMYGPPPPPPRSNNTAAVAALVGAACLFIGGIGGCTIGYLAGTAPTPAEQAAAPTVTSSPITAPTSEPTSEPATQTPSLSPSRTTRKAAPKKTPSPPPRNDPRYRTCAEANDRGYGPYFRDTDPEYDWYIDRDGDGVVCES